MKSFGLTIIIVLALTQGMAAMHNNNETPGNPGTIPNSPSFKQSLLAKIERRKTDRKMWAIVSALGIIGAGLSHQYGSDEVAAGLLGFTSLSVYSALSAHSEIQAEQKKLELLEMKSSQ